MQKEKKRVPELRFEGFEGEWEEKKLRKLSNRVTSKNKIDNQNVLTISAQKGLVSQFEYFNKSVSAKNLTGYYLLKRDDFAYNKSYSNGYPTGAIKRLNNYALGVVSTLYICFRFNECISLDFIEQYFESGMQNREISKVAQEGARNHGLLNIGVNDFFDINVVFPSLKEQIKNGSFLTSIDTRIQQLERKKTLLEEYKKGVMQKIFSQEIRFKTDSGEEFGEWEKRRLGEMNFFISDGNYGELYPKAEEMMLSGVPFIRANNIKRLTLTWNDMRYIAPDHHEVLKSGHLKTNDILITTRGDIGMVAIVNKEFNNANINAQICLLRCPEELNSHYILQYLGSSFGLRQFKRLQTGSALKQLPKGNLSKVIIPIPCLSEQTKIAHFLSALDTKIAVVDEQMEKTKEWKKGLLQRMFV